MFRAICEVQQVNMPLQRMRGHLKKLTSELGPLRIRRNSARQSVVVLEGNHEFNIEESPN